MICGIGIDMVAVAGMADFRAWSRIEAVRALLSASELEAFARAANPARFLAKRLAAKRALGKALGLGDERPLSFPDVAVGDGDGGPVFSYAPPLAGQLRARGIAARLSLSDERKLAIACVVLERVPPIAAGQGEFFL